MHKFVPVIFTLGLLSSVARAAVDGGEDQAVGPVNEKAKYVVSPNGTRLAAVTPKGSRTVVVVDGVEGPRVDDIVEITARWIDPRPYAKIDTNSLSPYKGVTFSRDGSRYAYLARLGQEWILMADNKEVMRIPAGGATGAISGVAGMAGNTDVRMEFSGESGKHLLFAKSSFNGYELWVDGQKWPGAYGSGGGGSEGTIDPIISADGEHIAYVAQMSRDKRALIVDGKEAPYFGTQLQFMPDNKRLLSVNQGPKGTAVLIDGKQLFAAREILGVYVPPVGNRLIFALTHMNKDGNAREGSFLLVDGKPVEATLTPEINIKKVVFSPDGKHYAAICGKTGNQYVVTDGKKGQEYSNIQADDLLTLANGITFSPDSTKLVYCANTNSGEFVVVNDEESDAMQGPWYRFSADGKHIAYGGMVNQMQKTILKVDGKTVPLQPGWVVSSFAFSPDGSRYAFRAQKGGDKGVFLDGKNLEMDGEFVFSPDSKHIAVLGYRGKDNKGGIFIDDQIVFETQGVLQLSFSPDGQHLFWMTREPATGAKAGPGVMEFVVYADGKIVKRCDSLMDSPIGNVRQLYGVMANPPLKPPPAWKVNAAGKLAFLGLAEDGIKRHAVAPSADTNLDSMIAEAKAAPARAAAKAAEEKKKAQEAAAAKKAKADADAADAAAKAKAEYDARVAQQKADYDARVAKQKADYEAAMAKRKADYEAAVAKQKADAEARAKKK